MNLKQESGDKWGPVKRPLTFLFTFFHFLTFRRYWILDIGDIGVWIKIVKAVDQDAVILVECVSFVSWFSVDVSTCHLVKFNHKKAS